MNARAEVGSIPEVPVSAPLSDGSSEQAVRGRYFDAMHDLVEDARAGGHMAILADVLAWNVAGLSTAYGLAAVGDMLAKIGRFMIAIENRKRAERELEQERKAGHLPN